MRSRWFVWSRAGVGLGSVAGLVLIASGCSADISRFDLGSSHNDGPTTGALPTPSEPVYDRSALGGSEAAQFGSAGSGGTTSGGTYYPPQAPGRDRGITVSALPDPAAERARAAPAYTPPAPPAATYAPPPAEADAAVHTAAAQRGEQIEVQPGDTLYGLSRRHRVSVNDLKEVNSLTTTALKPGQKLFLPVRAGSDQRPAAQPQPAPVAALAPADWTATYTIQPGDSLYGLSRRWGVKQADLQRYNGITNPRQLKPGAVLKVPASAAGAAETAQLLPAPAAPSAAFTTTAPTILNGARTAALETPGTATDAGAQPVQSVTVRGDQLAAAGTETPGDKLRWPARGNVIAGFGQRPDGTHNDGLNLAVPLGTEVHAAESGVVAYAGNELKGYGNLVLLRHDNGWVTAYAHADQLMVQRGDRIKRGQVIAKAGKTGQVDQPQLHFELRQGQKPVDPTPFMERL